MLKGIRDVRTTDSRISAAPIRGQSAKGRNRMLAKHDAEKFFAGAFGKIYTRELVGWMENMREQSGAKLVTQTAGFDVEAEEGETVIEVTLTLRVKSEDDEES